jgi:energy-coupling factor transport system permease protein
LLLLGGALAAGGLAVGGRIAVRSRYRPDPWSRAEWLVTASGLAPAVTLVIVAATGGGGLAPSTSPLEWPLLPVVPTLAVLAGLLPAWLAPEPPRPGAAPPTTAATSPERRLEEVG